MLNRGKVRNAIQKQNLKHAQSFIPIKRQSATFKLYHNPFGL